MNWRFVEKAAHWLLMAFIILYMVTGLGITEYRTVEALTLGLLTKQLAFKLHARMLNPLIILLGTHVYLVYRRRIERKARKLRGRE
ncbi:MAG TPA: hypothetical protein VM050_09015 [Patescibacteria group bacterium]|nr:hypothetical protein [Patescibacteria group bacterium]